MTRIRTGPQAYRRVSGRSILCVGTSDWAGLLWTNQQHLMRRLGEENSVVFVESLGLRRPTLAGRDLRRMVRRLRSGLEPPRQVDGVWVVSPLVLPYHALRAIRALNRRVLRATLRRALSRAGATSPILWTYNPHAVGLIGSLGESLVVYHCVDDVAAQAGIDEASFQSAERALARRADLVMASSRPLVARMKEYGARKVAYVPNVADVEHFAAGPELAEPAELGDVPHPRLIFAGAVVAKKLDVELLTGLAHRRPDWSIVLIGPVGEGDPEGNLRPLLAAPNIHLVGARPLAELPAWVAAADVCLIPYAINRYTASVFPMKVYEYLATGRPVVSTRLPSLAEEELISFADGAEEFEQAVERELSWDGPTADEQRRLAAASHSWENRLSEIAQLIAECEREPQE